MVLLPSASLLDPTISEVLHHREAGGMWEETHQGVCLTLIGPEEKYGDAFLSLCNGLGMDLVRVHQPGQY